MIPTPTTTDMQTVVAMAATVRLTLEILVGVTMILIIIQFIILGYVLQRMRVIKTKQSQFLLRDILIQQRNETSRRPDSLQVNFFYLSVRAVGLRRVTDNFFMPWPCQLFSRHGVRQGLLLWLFVASLSTKVGLFGHDYLPQESTLYSNRCQMLSWLC